MELLHYLLPSLAHAKMSYCNLPYAKLSACNVPAEGTVVVVACSASGFESIGQPKVNLPKDVGHVPTE